MKNDSLNGILNIKLTVDDEQLTTVLEEGAEGLGCDAEAGEEDCLAVEVELSGLLLLALESPSLLE